MTKMRTSLEAVPTPNPVEVEYANEIFVRLAFHDVAGEVMAFTMPVSALLRLLYSLAADCNEIVNNDINNWPPTFSDFNPN